MSSPRSVSFCRDPHRGFDSFYLKHHVSIDCRTAELVARYAAVAWEQLRNESPAATRSKFLLKIIFNENSRKPGYKIRGTSIVVVNLAHHPLDLDSPGLFAVQELDLRETIAEELHHVVYHRVFGEKGKDFKFDPEDGHPGVIHYYAFNRHELEALRFCVRTVGARAELLREVEEFLAGCKV